MKIIIVSGLEILAIAVLLGLWAPQRIGHVAFRIACLIVFLGYGVYLVAELRSGKEPALPRSRAESSPVNALLGLIVIGLPALRYAMLGRFASDDQQTSDDDDDSATFQFEAEQNGCRQRLVWHLSYHRRFPLAVA